MKNRYTNELRVAETKTFDAYYAAQCACRAADYFPAKDGEGWPEWEKCFFGETLEALKAARLAEHEIRVKWTEEEEKLEAEREARKVEREAADAAALNMTVEEYREHKKLQAKIRRYEREIADYEREIANLREAIEYRKKWIAERA